MASPTARAIYDAAEQAIFEIVSGQKKQASWNGRQYTAIDLPQLRGVSDYYRTLAIRRGELTGGPAEQRVTISYAKVCD